MAGFAVLDKEIEKQREATEQIAQNRVNEEEREHRRLMHERMNALLGEDVRSEPAEPVGAYQYSAPAPLRSEHVPAYQSPEYAATGEYHEPVVPNDPTAPSASRRIADYVPITVGMQTLQRMGDMPAQPRAATAEPQYSPAKERGRLFETLVYQNGELLDTAAPVREIEAPIYEPSYVPAMQEEQAIEASEDEDALPTRRTMESIHREESAAEARQTSMLSALSTRTKIVLATVAGIIALLLAIVCINTAIINSINEDVRTREDELARLEETMNGIDSEIERLTSQENVESWAVAHGMSK